MARLNAYVVSASDLLSVERALASKKMLAQVKKTQNKMTNILYQAMVTIERMAAKHGVSQYEGMPAKKVDRILHKLAKKAFQRYEAIVREGATLKQQKQFVKMFSKGRNLKAIRAAAHS